MWWSLPGDVGPVRCHHRRSVGPHVSFVEPAAASSTTHRLLQLPSKRLMQPEQPGQASVDATEYNIIKIG